MTDYSQALLQRPITPAVEPHLSLKLSPQRFIEAHWWLAEQWKRPTMVGDTHDTYLILRQWGKIYGLR